MWRWFGDLSAGRRPGALGPAPLGWDDIDSWARLTGNRPSPADIAALRDLDHAFLSHLAAKHRDSPRS